MERIAIVGLGRMGAPIARRLVGAGHQVVGYDVDGARRDAATRDGVVVARSLADAAAEADVLVTVLPGPGEAREALSSVAVDGAPGALASLPPGALWLDLTSNDPRVATEIAAVAAERDIAAVGAPMGGGPTDAEAGTLRFYAAGAAEHVDRAARILAPLASQGGIVRTGVNIADGYTTKLLINHLWFGQAVAVTEAMLLAQSLGIAPAAFRDALPGSAAESAFTTVSLPRLLEGDYLASFGIDRVVEELDAVVELAHGSSVPFELSTLVQRIHRDALDRFGPVDGELLASKLLEERAGSTLRAAPPSRSAQESRGAEGRTCRASVG